MLLETNQPNHHMNTSQCNPLLVSSDDNQQYDSNPSKKICNLQRLIILLVALAVGCLAIGLVLGLAVDWTNKSKSKSRKSNEYWQQEFLKYPSNDSCRDITVNLASSPHVASYPSNFETGNYIADLFEQWDFDTIKKEYWNNTILSHFVASSLKIKNTNNGNEWIELNISEAIIPSDADTTSEYRHHIWNAFGKSGNVTSSLIYINYGFRNDYEYLLNNDTIYANITAETLNGSIGIVRYGQGSRAVKVQIAQEFGLIGLLMFSDPEQYAPEPELVYPFGPWLPETGVQRGSTKYASCPGNPDLDRMLDLCGIDNMNDAIPYIPVIPVSAKTAKSIFANMSDGLNAPVSWYGEITDIEYKINSEQLSLNLFSDNELHDGTDFDYDSIMNVYGVIDGEIFPDEVVMIGAHRDAWAFGAQDDVSGTTTIVEIARGFGELLDDGWRPKRTMVFASWDGEESGLIGSTNAGESVNEEQTDVFDNVIVYLNLDMTTGGDTFTLSGHPLLRSVSESAMKVVVDPFDGNGDTFFDVWDGTWPIMGAGSDQVVFQWYLGVCSMDVGFKGEQAWGAYHSVYDTIGWQDLRDPNWKKAEGIAAFTGVLTMKLLDEELIPFNISVLANVLKNEWFNNLDNAAFNVYNCNPGGSYTSDLMDQLSETLDVFVESAMHFERNMSRIIDIFEGYSDNTRYHEVMEEINEFIGYISRQFTVEEGLPDRIWHKNILWDGSPENGPTNFFPYIWHAFEYNCTEEMLDKSFGATIDTFEQVISNMDDTLSNL